jgi:hypothetical protein
MVVFEFLIYLRFLLQQTLPLKMSQWYRQMLQIIQVVQIIAVLEVVSFLYCLDIFCDKCSYVCYRFR